ncbi:hypothetical protein [Streptomyces physcomitrii]|uniref:Uncharacterized protein n=1 Tax=Streptomyces physcomitrii TaxID=2724184 RepID=A0ABX1GXM8_9ACTN|nr:hypothetical protein [Streptomyces physcomitrii]NKI40537.1 hypothetical protein [Streptomyces physcomitrii]
MTTDPEQQAAPSGTPGPAERPGRGPISIGNVHGAFAIGDGNKVSNQVYGALPGPRPPEQEELLRAVQDMRADLARLVEAAGRQGLNPELTALVASAEREHLDAELAGAEAEIEEQGAADQGRRVRLRRALTAAGALTGFLASAATVTQALGAFAGG